LAFVAFTLGLGLTRLPYNQKVIFVESFAVSAVLIKKHSAPPALCFAVTASCTNLAVRPSQVGTKHLNQAFIVTREVKNVRTGQIPVPGRRQPGSR
jgi:hypothetical protein